MYPGISSYGMEADPPSYLCLKYECFLMADCSINIKVCDLDLKVSKWDGDGAAQNFGPISNIRQSINQIK